MGNLPYPTQLGHISMTAWEDTGVRMGRIPRSVELFSGVAAKSHENARFDARRRYTDARSGARREPAPPGFAIPDVDLNPSKRNTLENAADLLRPPDEAASSEVVHVLPSVMATAPTSSPAVAAAATSRAQA